MGNFYAAATMLKWASLLWLMAGMLSPAAAAAPGSKNKESKKGSGKIEENIFTSRTVRTIRIEIPKESIANLRNYQWGNGNRVVARATVTEGDNVYTNVALHLKGAAGSFRSIDENPALTLHFDKFVPGQLFHRLEKISLNNSVQDPSYLTEKICREMFVAAGVPAPRADHAVVVLNGRDLGLYVMVEGINKQFLAHYFKNTKGNLYDGGFLKDITEELEKISGENPKDQSDLRILIAAASEPDPAKRLSDLEKVLELDRFISFIALDVMLWDWDGYAIKKNNWRLYHDPDSGRFTFFPHGLDQMFWESNGPIFPGMEGLVARAVLQTTEGRRRYLARMSELLRDVFKVEVLTNRVNELATKIRPVLAERNPQVARSHDQEVAVLCDRIVQRARGIQQQLELPNKALKFDSAGVAHLAGWKPKTDFGNPVFAQTTNGSGEVVFFLGAAQSSSGGSWRTKVILEGGRYRLEGKAKTQGVVADPGDARAGAGLRVHLRRFTQKLMGDHDWADVAFEFDVPEAFSELDLVCELRAAKGEAWFDAESLRLVRK
jgi:hypothetical protein